MKSLLPTPETSGLSQTRSSLLGRLSRWDDTRAWSQFFETYWRYIYRCALKQHLNEDEAQEVVQEVMITVARKFRDGQYRHDRSLATFKTWLARIVHFLVLRAHRRRHQAALRTAEPAPSVEDDLDSSWDRLVEAGHPHAELWESEWRQNLVDVAAERVKQKVKPEHYQVFACRVIQGRSVTETARELGVSMPQVYLITHRLGKLLRQEFERLGDGDPVLPPGVSPS